MRFVVPSIMRPTSSGLRTVGSFRGVFGKGKSSKCMSRRLSIFLKKNRNADIRISTVPGLSFLSCSRYPDCRYRANKAKDGRPKAEPKTLDEACPVCGKPLVERRGRYGPFKSCSDYPRCKGPQRTGGRQKAQV